jgi:Prohead core protein serine protease
MALKLKLIAENPQHFEDFEYLLDEANRDSPSTLYVKGPFIGCNQTNKNKRRYDLNDTRNEVQRYINEMVSPGRAMGELNHPSSADVNLERACHLVTELFEVDNSFHGKAKVLSTPSGQILRSLINDGVKVGMSTRALGSLHEQSGYSLVQNMHLVAIDAVADPSYPKAFVNGILESKSFVVEQDGTYEELYDNFEKSIKTLPRKDVDQYLREQIIKFISAI